jgi:hypothetical protein
MYSEMKSSLGTAPADDEPSAKMDTASTKPAQARRTDDTKNPPLKTP